MDQADQLTPTDVKSFRHTIATTRLPIGTVLWRFSSSLHAPRFGAYWIDARTMAEIMRTFSTLNNYELAVKKKVIRDSLAVLSNWDTHLEYRVKIQLKQEVVAHVGIIGTQQDFVPYTADKTRQADAALIQLAGGRGDNISKLTEQRLSGGYVQYIIPRFRDRSLNQTDNKFARLLHFCHI